MGSIPAPGHMWQDLEWTKLIRLGSDRVKVRVYSGTLGLCVG